MVFRNPPRARAAMACTALAVALAACGSTPDTSVVGPAPAPDLLQSLPSITPTPVPTPTPKAKPKPVPQKAPAQPAAVRVNNGSNGGGGADPGSAGFRPLEGDEFNVEGLDPVHWNTYNSVGAFGTGYRRPEAVTVSGGQLHITARGDISGGASFQPGQLYGRWEFRARTTAGRGFGSAILLWPESEKWPDDGEIDMMEVPTQNRIRAHFVLHYGADNDMNGAEVLGDFTQWHTFALDWLPDRLSWYVDGVKRFETTAKAQIPTKPMHITVQLDQGPKDDWIDARDATTPAEVSLDVDWVRVYAR